MCKSVIKIWFLWCLELRGRDSLVPGEQPGVLDLGGGRWTSPLNSSERGNVASQVLYGSELAFAYGFYIGGSSSDSSATLGRDDHHDPAKWVL